MSVSGARRSERRTLAKEALVAIECNGLGYAVLMASPGDLVDLAFGFALTERLIDNAADVVDIDVHEGDLGIIVRMWFNATCNDRVLGRVRHRTTDASCGLCGIEDLEQALRPLPPLNSR